MLPGTSSFCVEVAGLDGDVLLDIVIGDSKFPRDQGDSLLHFNDPASPGTFTRQNLGLIAIDIAIGDVNNDGLPDIITVSGDPHIILLLSDTTNTGTFNKQVLPVTDVADGRPETVATGDMMNGDGLPDLIVGFYNEANYLYINDVNLPGSFTAPPTILPGEIHNTYDIAVTDMDSDGNKVRFDTSNCSFSYLYSNLYCCIRTLSTYDPKSNVDSLERIR